MSHSESMTVVVTITQNDYAKAIRAIAKGRNSSIMRIAFWLSLAFLSWMAYSLLRMPGRSLPSGLLVLVVLVLVVRFCVPYFAARSFVKKNPEKLGPTRHSIGHEGTSNEGLHGAGETKWSAFQRIRETKDLFLLYPQSNFAQIVPKRCFESLDEIQRYRQILRSCYKGKLELLS